jgi:hypothetical protein
MNQPPTLQQAAAALVAIEEAGQLATLSDEIICARRDWHKADQRRTIGQNIHIDGLARYLQADGINATEAWNAVRDCLRPSWGATLLATIVDFATALPVEGGAR